MKLTIIVIWQPFDLNVVSDKNVIKITNSYVANCEFHTLLLTFKTRNLQQ